jgi:hypothetical protein
MAFITAASLVALISALVIYVAASRFVVWKRLRHIPGPRLAGWSKFWLVRHQVGGRLCLDLPAVCDKYGETINPSATVDCCYRADTNGDLICSQDLLPESDLIGWYAATRPKSAASGMCILAINVRRGTKAIALTPIVTAS